MSSKGPPITKLIVENSLESSNYDGILLISSPGQQLKSTKLGDALRDALLLDPTLESEIAILPVPGLPAKRLVHSPTGKIDPDYDDVRVLKNAALKGMKRALKAGISKPLLVVEETRFENGELVTLLGALEAVYVPIQVREHDPTKQSPINHLGVFSSDPNKTKTLVDLATILESGRRVACDIGDGDPERMSPPNVENYILDVFSGSNIKLQVIKDPEQFSQEFPLFEAVNRAASGVKRHQGRIVFMEYSPTDPGQIQETVYLVGKGVTYDTGGIDVKINGAMVGMSRDKCGAAAVVGFLQVVRLLQPKNIKVVAAVSLVRNSIGSNGYVADEVITARSGARIRVGNTDAEGRMVMADVLCKMKELAVDAVNPHLFTVATLTGHAFLTVGEGYSIVMDNGPALKSGNSIRLQTAGDLIGDIFEISRIRSEDFAQHRGEAFGDDVKQANNQPSSRTPRGHQGPAAFLILAAGLQEHGSGSGKPLKYSHLDIAASAGEFPKPATGAPVLALAKAFLLD
ncbi:putative aminopeptidase W07G4.4 [Tribolium madens]|uniref:putative aminopeptidase W07G4.4 n=1 Tax=Tribolium madens TaxID=41895 RepID=UPI001CF72B4B|nr:putative aminopeptidase W07G4.4 [Tribolium madens]